jgi:GNAT superfamily N-acetyltransferase
MAQRIKHQTLDSTTGKPIYETLLISRLKEKDDLKFKCNCEEVNDFLLNDSKKCQREHLGITYLLRRENGELIGFVTLAAGSIGAEIVGQDAPPKNYPTLVLAWLGVNEKEERRGYGTLLVDFTISVAIKLRNKIGCQYVVVDSFPESYKFYKSLGFLTPIKSIESRKTIKMFLDLSRD